MNVKKVEKEWEIWDKEEKATRSEEEVKKLVPCQSSFIGESSCLEKRQVKECNEKDVEPCNRVEERIDTKKRENLSLVQKRERKSKGVYSGTDKEGVYQTIKVTIDSTGILCRKEEWKKRMVQDYWYLNEWIVKNNYPLPVILDIIKNIGTKKMFTKMNLKWNYNNIRIKERNK